MGLEILAAQFYLITTQKARQCKTLCKLWSAEIVDTLSVVDLTVEPENVGFFS